MGHSLQAVGTGQAQPVTISQRLIAVRDHLRNAHGRLTSAAGRAGLLPPSPPTGEKAVAECSDLNGVVLDIEHLCERLVGDCSEIEKIA